MWAISAKCSKASTLLSAVDRQRGWLHHLAAWRVGLLGLCLLTCCPLKAEVLLGPGVTDESLSSHLLILRDPSGDITPDQASAAFKKGRGETSRGAWPQFGFTPDTIWVSFKLRSALEVGGEWLIELRTARMDELDWYVYRSEGKQQHLQAGTQRPRNPALLDHKFPVLPLSFASGEAVEVLLRIRSQTSVHLPLRVWSPVHYAESQGRGESLFAAFLGYMAALILISLVLSLFSRDRGFVIYSLSLLTMLTNYLITTGYYAWLNLPAIPWASHMGTLLAAESTVVLLLFYFRYFFDLRVAVAHFDTWCVRPLIALTLLLTVFQAASSYRGGIQVMLIKSLVIGGFSMVVGLFFWFRGNRTARFYVLGWLAFWLLFAWTVLQFQGVVPMWTLPELPALVSIAGSTTFFFLAMADRVREIRQRADEAKTQILDLESQVSRGLQEQARQQQVLIRDLHDGIGGLTANLGILAELGRREAGDEKTRSSFRQIADLASEGAAEVRGLMNSLETTTVSWADLIDECRRQGEMRLPAHGVAFDLRIEGEPQYDEGPGLLPGLDLLRIYKEALTNVVKHAEASRVEVLFQFEAMRFRMTIRDNGKGFDAEASSGRGLASMESRIREWGGKMHRLAGPGAVLLFELPL
jgi:signal transduction histidine kinase